MGKKAAWKIWVGVLEALTAVAVIFGLLFGIPQANSWLSTKVTFFSVVFSGYQDLADKLPWANPFPAFTQFWGVILLVVAIVVLQLLTIWPLIAMNHARKNKNASPVKPLEADDNSYVVPFVDREGNFGHALLKGSPADIKAKYFGGLNDTQLDQEFDWHNYVGGRPVGRIITGVVLGFVALVLLLLRIGWYIFTNANVGPLGVIYQSSIVSTPMAWLDDNVEYFFFGNFKNIYLAMGYFTCANVLDGLLWIAGLFAIVTFVLVVCSVFVWLFRKPIGKKRALAARDKYVENLTGHTLAPVFVSQSRFAVGAQRPSREMRGEIDASGSRLDQVALSGTPVDQLAQGAGDVSALGTGVVEISPVRFNVEGNVIRKSVSSYSVSSLDDDVLLLDPTLISSIIALNPSMDDAVKSLPVEYLKETKPVAQPVPVVVEASWRPSDEAPEYWYGNASIQEARPSDEETSHWFAPTVGNKPSDEEPAFWFGNVSVPVAVKPVASEPVKEVEAASYAAPYTDLYERLANALEPFRLTPAPEAENEFALAQPKPVLTPADNIPEAWYGQASVEASGLPIGVETQAAALAEPVVVPSKQPVSFWFAGAVEEVNVIKAAGNQVKTHPYGQAYGRAYQGLVVGKALPQGSVPNYVQVVNVGGKPQVVASGLIVPEAEGEAIPPVALAPIFASRPSDKTPDYWYLGVGAKPVIAAPVAAPVAMAKPATPIAPAVIAPVAVRPVVVPSEQPVAFWFANAVEEVTVSKVAGSQVETRPSGQVLYGNVYQGFLPRQVVSGIVLQGEEASAFKPVTPATLEAIKETPSEAIPPVAVAPVFSNRPSDKTPDYWFVGVGVKPVVVAPIAVEVAPAEPVPVAPIVVPSEQPAAFWYGGAVEEANVAKAFGTQVETRPSGQVQYGHVYQGFLPHQVVSGSYPKPLETITAISSASISALAKGPEIPAVAQAPVFANRASDKTPDYWYSNAGAEPIVVSPVVSPVVPVSEKAPVVAFVEKVASVSAGEPVAPVAIAPIVIPSEQPAAFWYEGAKETLAVKANQGKQVETHPSGEVLYGRAYQGFLATNGIPSNASLPTGNWTPGNAPIKTISPEIEKAQVTAKVAHGVGETTSGSPIAPVATAPVLTNRPSDKTPDYWYGNVQEGVRAKPISPVSEEETTEGEKVTPVVPIAPVKPIAPVAPIKHEEEKPESAGAEERHLGPVTLQHAIQNAKPVEIKPVQARHVWFQLKKVSGGYKGALTPEEAFNKAITNQEIVVSPVFAGQTKPVDVFAARKEKAAKQRARRTGYVVATAVVTPTAPVASEKFDKPVTAFPSIREWKKAKRQWEREKAAQVANAPSPTVVPTPVAPITPIVPVTMKKEEKPAEEKAKEPEGRPIVKPLVPLAPIKPAATIKPITPVKPLSQLKKESKKKGE